MIAQPMRPNLFAVVFGLRSTRRHAAPDAAPEAVEVDHLADRDCRAFVTDVMARCPGAFDSDLGVQFLMSQYPRDF